MATSALLRSRTAAAHAQVERAPFLVALAAGQVARADVAALLARLLPVYDALEDAARPWAGDQRVGRFVVPELHRAQRLRADLERLRADQDVSPAAQAYAQRVTGAATTAAGFVAHHYTRYVGDLSGGRTIGDALARHLGLDLAFFAFPDVPDDLVPRYRRWLDETPFTAPEREELVAEVLAAYRLSAAVVEEVERARLAP